MVRLVTDDGPDVVALQEVPVWALRELEGWSGMRGFSVMTKRALLRPVGRRLQRLDPGRVRSPLTGQGNALLVGTRLDVAGPPRAVLLNPGSGRERRFCQLVEAQAGSRTTLLANFHATTLDERAALEEIGRVAELVAGASSCVVCGDFNVPEVGLPGFSEPGPGIDQILVRGLELVEGPAPWPDERRKVDAGVLLSDHAPIEAVAAWT